MAVAQGVQQTTLRLFGVDRKRLRVFDILKVWIGAVVRSRTGKAARGGEQPTPCGTLQKQYNKNDENDADDADTAVAVAVAIAAID
jgi:hypothetical protein